MPEFESVMGRRAPDGFARAVAGEIRQQVALDRKNPLQGMSQAKHVGALDSLASFVDTLLLEDQRLVALHAVAVGTESWRGKWVPTSLQMLTLGRVGHAIGGFVQTSEALLAELVAMGIEDLVSFKENRTRNLIELRDREARDERRQAVTISDDAKKQIRAARAAQRVAEDTATQLQYQLKVALARLSDEAAEEVRAERKEVARDAGAHDRKPHPEHDKIYHRRSESGDESFFVYFRENNQPRYKSFKGNLDAALAWRDEHYDLAEPESELPQRPVAVAPSGSVLQAAAEAARWS